MAQSVIGALRVDLGLNSAKFTNGMKKADKSLNNFGRKVKQAFAVVAAASAAAGAAMAVALNRSAKAADEMIKASRALGQPVEDLSRLAFAASQSGVELKGLETAIGRLNKNMNDAKNGIGTGRRAFEELGISVTKTDGTLKSSKEVLEEIADEFQKLPDGPQKTALAMDLMGRSGAKMISLLNGGSEGMRKLGDEAERLGLVFTHETAEASERFNDNLVVLGRTFEGVFNRVLQNVIPALSELTNKFVEGMTQGGNFDLIVQGISKAMILVARGIGFVFDNLNHLLDLFKIFIGAKVITYVGSIAGAFITMARGVALAGVSMKAITAIMRAKITAVLLLAAALTKVAGRYEQLEDWVKQTGAAIEASLPESVAAQLNDFGDTLSGVFDNISGTNSEAVKDLAIYLDAQNDAVVNAKKMGSTSERAGKAVAGLAVESEKFRDAWSTINPDAAATAAERSAKSIENTYQGVADTVKGAFGSAFDSIKSGSFDASASIRELGFNLLNLFANRAVDNLFGSMNFSSLGSSLGAPVKLPSFDGGGDTYKGPRSGGLDGKGGFLAMLHPNERVDDLTRPGGSSGGSASVRIELGPDLIGQILQETNGATVQIVQSGISEYRSKQLPTDAMRAVQKGVKSGKSISA